MELKSIIWLDTSRKSRISKKVIENLNLEGVYERLLLNEEILYSLCMDIETIRFRQEIISDLLSHEGLLEDLVTSLEAFYELKPLYHEEHYEVSTLYRIIDILIVMEKSIAALDDIFQILHYYKVESQGLKVLHESVIKSIQTKEFKEMKKDLKEIRYVFKSIKSATLSVNMSTGLRPVFAQVTSIDDHKYRYPKAFRKVSDVLNANQEFLGERISNYVPVFKVKRLNYDLLEEIEFALEDHKEMLAKFVETYHRIDIKPFVKLLDEIEFYKASVDLARKMTQVGLPLTIPEIDSDALHFKMDIKGLYNINLAIYNEEHMISEEMVLNDFLMDESHKGYVITGANRGGKTTFTQAIGQIQLFAQLGLLVPCKECHLTLVDRIITHFPIGEKDTYEKGKFGKECEMFVEGFNRATKNSLYLLNESFTGTSHLESLNIANQGCLALLDKGVPFIFNTHLHELYDELIETCRQEDRDKIMSLVTKMQGENSIYKLVLEKPFGKSYARKIASKYGVTYDQLIGGDSDAPGN